MPVTIPPGTHPAVTGAAVAADALRYVGKGYVFGGPADVPGDWDCSSFVSYVLGHDLGMQLPGGRYGDPGFPPSAHGPVVESYGSWDGAAFIPESTAGAGDLVLWIGVGAAGHMGIVLGPDKMVSALNSQQGTLVSPITGFGPVGVTQQYRRLTGAGGAIPPGGGGVGGGGGILPHIIQDPMVGLAAGALLAGAMALAVLGLAALVGVALAGGGVWAARKVAQP